MPKSVDGLHLFQGVIRFLNFAGFMHDESRK